MIRVQVSSASVETLVRRGGITYHHLIAYSRQHPVPSLDSWSPSLQLWGPVFTDRGYTGCLSTGSE